MNFEKSFKLLTGSAPFPWQEALYKLFVEGAIPQACNIPTGLGKTSVIAVWLIAWKSGAKVPRRLVYVVNRRTVVDQTTKEAEKLRENANKIGVDRLAISTLRGQFQDNREWFADPSCPAIICGTVDMIGSRLLFSGYRIGFKSRPLHAGFLGQDALVVHDEAHLEPAFQALIETIRSEQERRKEFMPFHVMEMTATTRSDVGSPGKNEKSFELTDEERKPPEQIPDPNEGEPSVRHVWRRLKAVKQLSLKQAEDGGKIADEIADRALEFRKIPQGEETNVAILVFVRTIDDVKKVVEKLTNKKDGVSSGRVQRLTGTMRGFERDALAERDPVFMRFLPAKNRNPDVEPAEGAVYLVSTSAGEVGVDLSADHMVCDLSTFESMAQRFGRVNRYGERKDTRIGVVYPAKFEEGDKLTPAREATLVLLNKLKGDASPLNIGFLDAQEKQAAFAPPPTILPATDILFDTWALTTIRERIPGRPPVAPYLHGVAEWQPPETEIAWREEVRIITGDLRVQYPPEDLLEDYPLKPHELLRDRSSRIFDGLQKLASKHPNEPAWLVDEQGKVAPSRLGDLADTSAKGMDKKRLISRIEGRTILLSPAVGGLSNGMFDGDSAQADDVADAWRDEKGLRRRRFLSNEPRPGATEATRGMALIGTIDTSTNPDAEESESGNDESETKNGRYWHWFVRLRDVEDATRASIRPVSLEVHLGDVKREAEKIVSNLDLSEDLKKTVVLAAEFHDLGKARELWQRGIGNPNPQEFYAKGGKPETGPRWRPQDISPYRHEFGSVLDALSNPGHRGRLEELSGKLQDLVLHLIAAHHGRARPHFPHDEVFDPDRPQVDVEALAGETPRRFARLQRRYGRWGLAYLESLVRAADWAASAAPSSDKTGSENKS